MKGQFADGKNTFASLPYASVSDPDRFVHLEKFAEKSPFYEERRGKGDVGRATRNRSLELMTWATF